MWMSSDPVCVVVFSVLMRGAFLRAYWVLHHMRVRSGTELRAVGVLSSKETRVEGETF